MDHLLSLQKASSSFVYRKMFTKHDTVSKVPGMKQGEDCRDSREAGSARQLLPALQPLVHLHTHSHLHTAHPRYPGLVFLGELASEHQHTVALTGGLMCLLMFFLLRAGYKRVAGVQDKWSVPSWADCTGGRFH